jgi:hypothetical protein
MRRNKFSFFLVLLLFIQTSCIKRFDPEIQNTDAVKFVVTGQVNKGDDVQRVNISTSSQVSNPRLFPVAGCNVKIIDDKGNSYMATDVQNGNYEIYIPQSELSVGSSFKVDIVVLGGANLVSDFDQIHDGPEIDTVYYQLEQLPVEKYKPEIDGIRFYLDLDAKAFTTRYFRWEATETWEYKAKLASSGSTKKICWSTAPIKSIYLVSTKNLTQNKYYQFPLHFIDNMSSPRLSFGYSLLVRQYAMSEASYTYWQKIQENSTEQGGLYEKQPLAIKGNIRNISDPNQIVLGYFSANTVKSKRIFVQNVKGLPVLYVDCEPEADPMVKPDPRCFNCLLSGGTNVKPSFWPF